MIDTAMVTTDAAMAAVVRRTVPFAQIPAAQREARRVLDAALPAWDIEPGRRLTVWWMPRDGAMDYAPGRIVPRRVDGGPDVSMVALPAGRAAHRSLVGGFDGLPAAWRQLFADCAAQGWALSGMNWEIYPEPGEDRTDLYAQLA